AAPRSADLGAGHPGPRLRPGGHDLEEDLRPAVPKEEGLAEPGGPLTEEDPRLVALEGEELPGPPKRPSFAL
ncbi:MAG: hypothetical protein QW707_06970, partial [Candidatus Bathyarchaeia archaeon]